MKNLRNKNQPVNADLVQVYLQSSWDIVTAVYAELDDIQTVADAINGGGLGNYLTAEDIDTIAELNAILTDATLGRFSTQGEAEGGSDNTTTMTPLRVAQAIASQVTTLQHNYTGTAPPTVTDDSNAGYGAGSIWFDTTADPDETYRCTDPSVGAAVWIKTSLTSDELATVAISGDSDDLIEGATNLLLTAVERSRLAGMEDNATADQTDSEIKTAYENLTTLVSQVEAEAGTSTTIRTWTAERVKQAIVALGGGNGLSGDYINTNTNALAGTHYQVDTTGGAVTLTLPASPVDGDYISFADSGGQAGTNFITIGRNGNTIDGVAADGAMVSNGMLQVYIWDGANTDWKTWSLTPHPDPGGGGGGLTPVFITSNYTASAGEEIFVGNITAAITVTLPATPSDTNQVIVHAGPDASAYNVTVDGDTTDTIDGDLTFVLDQNYSTFNGAYDGITDNEWKNAPIGVPNLVSANVLFAVYKDVNYQGEPGDKVMCGTLTSALTMDMPISPVTGTVFSVWDAENNAGTNNVTIDPGAESILGVTGNAIIDENGGRFDFIFDGIEWKYSYWAPTTPHMVTGTFTPTIQDSTLSDAEGQTYTRQDGAYQKIDNLVTFQIQVTLSSKGTLTATDQVYIAGLPFLPNQQCGVVVSYANNLSITANVGPVTGVIGFSLTEDTIRLYQWDATSGVQWFQISDIGATTALVLSGSYTTDD